MAAEAAVPGLLMVQLRQNSLSDTELNHWYNNIHIPGRMRYPFFLNGRRYSRQPGYGHLAGGRDGGGTASNQSNWLGLYDISDMHQLCRPPYSRLLDDDVQSTTDREFAARITAERQYFDHVATYAPQDWRNGMDNDSGSVYGIGQSNSASRAVLIIVRVRLHVPSNSTPAAAEAEWNRWYEMDHLPALRHVPGWRRTRRYQTSVVESQMSAGGDCLSRTEYMTINEFTDQAHVGGPLHQIAIRTESLTKVVALKTREYWRLEYVLGKGPKDLLSLGRFLVGKGAAGSPKFVSADGWTQTMLERGIGKGWPVIEGHIPDPDQNDRLMAYRIEGWGDEESHVVAMGTSHGMSWKTLDPVVSSLLQQWKNLRVLRVSMQPRLDLAHLPVTSDELYKRLAMLMASLCESLAIPHPVLTLGVSLGEATVADVSHECVFRRWPGVPAPQNSSVSNFAVKTGLVLFAHNMNALKGALEKIINAEVMEFDSAATWIWGGLT